ncbi:carboxypeptidase-like regulatory domain-containing protein [Lewinella sp. W8]|uniref:carboxypeptidase-like regulatory domain-containing protein n=1 Tax=Lewinella sp. W8 TaxID=2528208 RepID=UPI0010683D70|nr:carboxypeptidase-like regulatory domain-containing protein [Lewinella sp. W8]MTB51502.1 hypothetical protein [Lewinella sp. W8]
MRLSLLLLFLPSILLAQYELTGTVLEANTGNPLPYVNVFLEGDQSVGVLTNERGEYRLSLTEAQLQDRVVFSLLSFQTHREPLWRLDTTALFFNLSMETAFVELEEVIVISDIGLRKIVQRAIDAIPDNYAREGHLIKGYLRRYDIDNDTFSYYTEALVNIRERSRKKNFDPWEPITARIEQFRSQATDIESLRTNNPAMNLQAGLLAGYLGSLNFGRSGEFGGILLRLASDKQFTKIMNFSNRGEYLNGPDTLIRIAYRLDTSMIDHNRSFTSGSIDAWFSGEFLINKADNAFIQYARGNEEATSFGEVVYFKHAGKYYPKRLSYSLRVNYKNNTRTHFRHNDLFLLELYTDSGEIRKNYRGVTMNMRDPLEAIKVKYDLDFWARSKYLVQLSAPEEMRYQLERMQQFLEDPKGKLRRDSTK